MNKSRTLISLAIVIVLLAGLHWYLNTRSTSFMNTYGSQASSTPVTIDDSQVDKGGVTEKTINNDQVNNQTKNFMHTITLETSKGTIVFETYDADAPKTVNNFITLANKGFYNGVIFHRVINGFMIQGGDPTGTGTGGPGYKFEDELNPETVSYKTGYVRGTVAMANAGPNTNGSQFFIMHKDNKLPNSYTIFGKVISGMDVVDAIASVKVGVGDKPVENVVIKTATVK